MAKVAGCSVLSASQSLEVFDKKVDAIAYIQFLKEGSAESGVFHEFLSDGIAHDGWIRGEVEELSDLGNKFIGESKEEGFRRVAEARCLARLLALLDWFRGNRKNTGEWIGFPREPFREADAAKSVKEEVRMTILVFARGSNEPRRSDLCGTGGRVRNLAAC